MVTRAVSAQGQKFGIDRFPRHAQSRSPGTSEQMNNQRDDGKD